MSVREIQGHLRDPRDPRDPYGIQTSPQFVSTVSDGVLEEVGRSQNRFALNSLNFCNISVTAHSYRVLSIYTRATLKIIRPIPLEIGRTHEADEDVAACDSRTDVRIAADCLRQIGRRQCFR